MVKGLAPEIIGQPLQNRCAVRYQLGLKTALIEKRHALGGTCLNVGCIPSKALLESSELYEAAERHSKDHGIVLSEIKLDLEAMLARKGGIVKELTDGVGTLMKKNKVSVLHGRGIVTAPGMTPASSSPVFRVAEKSKMTNSEGLTLTVASIWSRVPS